MSKHTPGPWNWVNPQTDEPWEVGEFRGSLRTVAKFQSPNSNWMLPKWILDMEEVRGDTNEENEANLRLIAAAPDLLEALKMMHELVAHASPTAFFNGVTDSTGSIDEGDVMAGRIIDEARAAIFKATGEA